MDTGLRKISYSISNHSPETKGGPTNADRPMTDVEQCAAINRFIDELTGRSEFNFVDGRIASMKDIY